jgi:hypothetical protein
MSFVGSFERPPRGRGIGAFIWATKRKALERQALGDKSARTTPASLEADVVRDQAASTFFFLFGFAIAGFKRQS